MLHSIQLCRVCIIVGVTVNVCGTAHRCLSYCAPLSEVLCIMPELLASCLSYCASCLNYCTSCLSYCDHCMSYCTPLYELLCIMSELLYIMSELLWPLSELLYIMSELLCIIARVTVHHCLSYSASWSECIITWVISHNIHQHHPISRSTIPSLRRFQGRSQVSSIAGGGQVCCSVVRCLGNDIFHWQVGWVKWS